MGERKVVVYGPSRVPWLRPLARPSVPKLTYLGCAVSGSVAGGFLSSGHRYTALVLVGATALAATPVLAALGSRRHVVLTGAYGWRIWIPIGKAYASLLRSLPELHPMIELRPTRLALERARFDHALLVARRQRVEAAHATVRTAGYGLAGDDPVRDELELRTRLLGDTLDELDAEITRRTAELAALAERWAEFAYRRAAERRAARASRKALGTLAAVDATVDAGPPVGTDPVPELAERTEAVLSAYRELTVPVSDR
ncbi:hypothetical protein DLE60_23000 [Micromonospora globispora]|uniref:hypothetical protein n=1 Tax=Micromonospora globispora TaxID=1450148 RepID=UPI000D6ECC39|nr:hypothetical protein [Micromonospora globispora]PWU58194.1 hypothetical protein DLE60_23000 [Micromonospora globispora]RQX08015.1 hypothetical protein DKL51_00440 [Micromonospora globispora]